MSRIHVCRISRIKLFFILAMALSALLAGCKSKDAEPASEPTPAQQQQPPQQQQPSAAETQAAQPSGAQAEKPHVEVTASKPDVRVEADTVTISPQEPSAMPAEQGQSQPAAEAPAAAPAPEQAAEQPEKAPQAPAAQEPAAQTERQTAGAEDSYGGGQFASKPAMSDDFTSEQWSETQVLWRVATWKQNNTQMSPERSRTEGEGYLVQTVMPGEPFMGGSMQSAQEYPYGRWVARLKPSSVPGVLNSMFTMDWDDLTTPDDESDGSKFEVDIEFLTYTFGPGKGKVHLAIHVQGHHNLFVEDVPLDFNPSDDFHVWGFDILPDKVVWHVDGKELRSFQRPEGIEFPAGYEFFFNSWSSLNWIKGPANQEARYLIDWVRFYPLVEQ